MTMNDYPRHQKLAVSYHPFYIWYILCILVQQRPSVLMYFLTNITAPHITYRSCCNRTQSFQILLMKANGLLSMIASQFVMRDVLIRYNKGERIRLTHEIVFEVGGVPRIIHYFESVKYIDSFHYIIIPHHYITLSCVKLSVANFWGSFFSPFMSTWMGEYATNATSSQN